MPRTDCWLLSRQLAVSGVWQSWITRAFSAWASPHSSGRPIGHACLAIPGRQAIRIERAHRAARETDARFRTRLRIGVADGIAQPKLSQFLVRWREVVPEVPLELTEIRTSELADALQHEELDAGFSFGLPDDDAIAR